jgi:hypothetical protein
MARQSSGITLFLNSLICLGSLLRSLHGRQIRSPSSKPRTLIFHRLDRRMPLRSPIEDHGYFSWLHRRTAYDSQKSLPRSQHQSQFGGHGRGRYGDVGSHGRAQGWTVSNDRKGDHHRKDWSSRRCCSGVSLLHEGQECLWQHNFYRRRPPVKGLSLTHIACSQNQNDSIHWYYCLFSCKVVYYAYWRPLPVYCVQHIEYKSGGFAIRLGIKSTPLGN